MATDAAFWDRIAPKYAQNPITDTDAYEHTIARTRAHLSPSDHVLELGCGTGSLALRLAPFVAHLTATDYAPGMLEIAREKAETLGQDNLSFQQIAAETPQQAQFDALLAFNMLHLLERPEQVIAQAFATLRPGGMFLSKTPCMQGRMRALWLPARIMSALGKWPRFRFISAKALEQKIRDAGFEIIETGNFHKTPPRLFVAARKPAKA